MSISRNSSLESNTYETGKFQRSKNTIKQMKKKEEVHLGANEAAERLEILNKGKEESNDSIQAERKIISWDKYKTSDAHGKLRKAFHARRDSTI